MIRNQRKEGKRVGGRRERGKGRGERGKEERCEGVRGRGGEGEREQCLLLSYDPVVTQGAGHALSELVRSPGSEATHLKAIKGSVQGEGSGTGQVHLATLGVSLDLSQVVEATHGSLYRLVHADQRSVAHQLLGFLTAVVVEGACQRDTHGRESRLDLEEGTDQHHQQGQQYGQVVGHPVRDVVLGGLIVQASQDAGQESPEWNGLVIGDVKCLPAQGRMLRELLCSQDVSVDHILHEAEVHQVLPISNYELHLALSCCLNKDGDQLRVPWTKDAMGPDSCGEEILLRIIGTQHGLLL